MIKNYIKIAWRNLSKNKGYSALNIVGLAVGMAVALLIGLWVFDEYSYNRFLPNTDRLYQVKMNLTSQQAGTFTQTALALPLADVLKQDYPEFEYVAEANWNGTRSLIAGDKKLYIDGSAVGSDFLKIFQFSLIKGDLNTVLKDPLSIVLTASTAKALFNNSDPIGKIVRIDNLNNVKVTGVLKDIPANSSLQFNYLLPFSYNERTPYWEKDARSNWGNKSYKIYAMLKPGITYEQIAPKIKSIVYEQSEVMRIAKPEIIMQPIKDWHLYAEYENGVPAGGFIEYVRMFGLIGILVLLIACINFMNLSTARSEKRAREVGVRKAMGSLRRHLILQFLTESVLIAFLSFGVAIIFVQLVIPAFNEVTGKFINIPYSNPVFWLIMAVYVLLTGLLAGSRPAFYLSSFNPVKVLKGTVLVGKAATFPRKVLVVAQFACSIALIISTAIIYQQIQYAKNRPIGYNTNQLVMSDMSDDLNKNYDAFKDEIVATGLVKSIAHASSPVTNVYQHTTIFDWPKKNTGEEPLNVATVRVSDGYFKTVEMQILQGRDFSSSWLQDTSNVLINEAAAKRMGLKQPLGKKIKWNGGPDAGVEIIGVVKNALMDSPFAPVEATIFSHGSMGNVAVYVLKSNSNIQRSIKTIGRIFDKYNPAYPFSYRFADEAYAEKFNEEVLVGKLAGIFATLAIFISCLGLFGLAAYIAEQRTKEIGIRKVLGASVAQVWGLLSTDFIVLVFISCLLASPIAYYFLHSWLLKYQYRITIGADVFIVTTVAAVIITLVTISFQSIKAALANPVKSLKNE